MSKIQRTVLRYGLIGLGLVLMLSLNTAMLCLAEVEGGDPLGIRIEGPVSAAGLQLTELLNLVMAETGVDMVVQSGAGEGKVTFQLSGDPTVGKLLDAVLPPLGLQYTLNESGVIAITAAAAADRQPAPSADGDLRDFVPAWQPWQLERSESYGLDDKIVGTHYFYWYEYPDYHFYDNRERTDDALQDHFVNPEEVSFNSAEWHQRELDDIAAAGIDFILPVYWGIPDNYFRPGTAFSVKGLGPLQWAIEERAREGKPSPKIGMFYDTSTLLPSIRGVRGRGEKYDLTTPLGKDIFYRTIRDFFQIVEPQHWACVDGRPIVVLYASAFAANHDQSTIDYVYEQFAEDFHGIKPYVVKDQSWSFETDAVTAWGAALAGARIFGDVAQIGPGYNDSAVPGRSTPIREREDGDFYRKSWIQAIQSGADMVLIETWNEMHEGTSICRSAEYGREYIELTRHYAGLFKRGEEAEDNIELEFPRPVPRPAGDRGKEYANADAVEIQFGEGGSKGIYLVRGQPDGPAAVTEIEGRMAAKTPEEARTYMYFDVADPYYFNGREAVAIEYTYWDGGFDHHAVEYDSHDPNATLDGAYKMTETVQCGNTNRWRTHRFILPDARFVNRENGGSDFRFNIGYGWLAVSNVKIARVGN